MSTVPPSVKLRWQYALSHWLRSSLLPSGWRRLDEQTELHHQTTYDAAYYEFIEFSSAWSQDAMANSIVRDLNPRTVLDIGCGTGALLEALQKRNVEVTGLEYSDVALEICQKRGLPVYKFDIARHRLPNELKGRDVVISFEVAEHLAPRLANRFVGLLSSAGDTVVLSAATPGQGGTDHLNEQPHEYWIEKMAKFGFGMDGDLSLRWREEWHGRTADWYNANVMVFRRPRA